MIIISLTALVLTAVSLRFFRGRKQLMMWTWFGITAGHLIACSYLVKWTILPEEFNAVKTWNRLLPDFDRSQWRITEDLGFRVALAGPPDAYVREKLRDHASLL